MASGSADYRFVMKESAYHQGGTWCLECYPQTVQLPFISGTGCMYIQFKKGVSEETAKQIKDLLNKTVEVINVVD
jgi:hypothetical protein